VSRENVEIMGEFFERFLRADDRTFEHFDPAVEWTTAEDEPDSQTYHGIEGVKRLLAMLFEELWERDSLELLSIEFLDAGRFVVVPVSARVTARQSGLRVKAEETYLCELENGKVVRVMEYRTKREALEAAGLVA
jgi:ketosteroid isomerase-like protein